MPKLETTREYPGKKSGECYQACLKLLPAAGYTLFKKRDIASLVIGNGKIGGHPAELTLVVPLGGPARVVLTLSGDQVDESALKAEADRLFELLGKQLK